MKHDDDKDRGTVDQITGKAKEKIGELTGDRRMEGEGKLDQVKGKAKEEVADIRDRLDERSERD
jgi:uncharacterized protein YjbJ (UPF0337 family)